MSTNTERLIKAASLVVQSKFDRYRKGNGHMASIEGDDGEKCWIVPFDPMTMLESAVKEFSAPAVEARAEQTEGK